MSLATVTDIIAYAEQHHIRLTPRGDNLHLAAVEGVLPPEFIQAAKQHKPEILRVLTQPPVNDTLLTDTELAAIHRWLDSIGETDPAMIADCLDRCRRDPAAREYCLRQAAQLPAPANASTPCRGCDGSGCGWCGGTGIDRPGYACATVRCADCQHFQRTDHPHLGHCAAGQPESPTGLWDSDSRACDSFQAGTPGQHTPPDSMTFLTDRIAGRPRPDRVQVLAQAFYAHLFGPAARTGCCSAHWDRYCPEGQRLRDDYYSALHGCPDCQGNGGDCVPCGGTGERQ